MLDRRIGTLHGSDCPDDDRNCGGQALPLGGFVIESLSSGLGQGIIFGAPIVLADGPFGIDPAVLFELVKTRVKGALPDLQHFAGHLADALGDGPPVHGFEGDHFQDEEVQRALYEIGRLAQRLPSVTDRIDQIEGEGKSGKFQSAGREAHWT